MWWFEPRKSSRSLAHRPQSQHKLGRNIRRVADDEIEAVAERASRVVLAAHPGLRMNEPGDARSDRIVFDAGEAGGFAQHHGHEREEQAGTHAGLQHASGGEAEMLRRAPYREDQ